MSRTLTLYDALSKDYDRFVNWPARLTYEMPFLIDTLRGQRREKSSGVCRVLDTACGTGQHAIAYAREGLRVVATDASQAMIDRAQENATRAAVDIETHVVPFGGLAASNLGEFDAITCLGNSLPHAIDEESLNETLTDWHQALAPSGIVIVQSRSFDRVIASGERFMPPETHREGENEWVFVRFYDQDEPIWRFNIIRMHRQGRGKWASRIEHTLLRPWRYRELAAALKRAGFSASAYGNLRGEPFNLETSSDLVLVAQRG